MLSSALSFLSQPSLSSSRSRACREGRGGPHKTSCPASNPPSNRGPTYMPTRLGLEITLLIFETLHFILAFALKTHRTLITYCHKTTHNLMSRLQPPIQQGTYIHGYVATRLLIFETFRKFTAHWHQSGQMIMIIILA